MEEFELASSNFTKIASMELTGERNAWICQVPSQGLLDEDSRRVDQLVMDESQIFLEDLIDLFE